MNGSTAMDLSGTGATLALIATFAIEDAATAVTLAARGRDSHHKTPPATISNSVTIATCGTDRILRARTPRTGWAWVAPATGRAGKSPSGPVASSDDGSAGVGV